MKKIFFRSLTISFSLVLLPGCVTYVQPPPPEVQPTPVYVAPPVSPAPVEYVPASAPEEVVVIHTESDFYEPLSPYGRWIEVSGYGRCWAPSGVDREWRPYTHGHWERTEAGWYWVSDEPWGWATCHYGRWNQDAQFGWVWVPQTEWAPAWVAWREGGGYTGWAPLPPRARGDAHAEHREQNVDPHSFVFVEERRMLEPQRPQTVIVNNITIMQKTVNITKVVVVNKTVINEGPSPETVAIANGHKVEVKSAQALRTRQEAPAVKEHHLHMPEPMKTVLPPAQNQQDLGRKEQRNKSPGADTMASPRPSQTDQSEQLQHQANQPHKRIDDAQVKPDLSAPPHSSVEHENEIRESGQKMPTPQQKLELEKKKRALEKEHQEEEKHRSFSTNSPAPLK